MNYFESMRLDWIFEMLHVYGFINREHLRKKFQISEIQASKDLSRAAKLNSRMIYNLSAKRYELQEIKRRS